MELNTVSKSVYFSTETMMNHEIDRNLICSICHEILNDPLECKNCHNCFCKVCIENWRTSNDSCPFRCKEFLLKNPHKIVFDALKNLTFRCNNHLNGCTEILSYSGYLQHIKYCGYKKIKCVIDKCEVEVLNKDYENHILNECEYKVHLCGKCGFETYGTKKMPHNCLMIAKSFLSDLKFKYFNYVNNAEGRLSTVNDKLRKLKDLLNFE
jgi:hypothetical protein